jgi:hypothetical protein
VAFLFTSILIFGYYLSKARILAKVRQVGVTIQFTQQVWSGCVQNLDGAVPPAERVNTAAGSVASSANYLDAR